MKLLFHSIRSISQHLLLWGWVFAIGLWLSGSTLSDGPGNQTPIETSPQSVSFEQPKWNQFNPSFDPRDRLKGITQELASGRGLASRSSNPESQTVFSEVQIQGVENRAVQIDAAENHESGVQTVDYTQGRERNEAAIPPNSSPKATGFPQNGVPLGKVDTMSNLPNEMGKSDDRADQVGAAGEVIGFSHSDGSGTLTITLVHTGKSSIAVYHIGRSGEIRLMSSRPIDADFSILLNATSPTPPKIRAMIDKR